MDIVISDVAAGHSLVESVVEDPCCRDLVERAARQILFAAKDVERREETHYQNCIGRYSDYTVLMSEFA